MKSLLTALLFLHVFPLWSNPEIEKKEEGISVYVFLHDACVICQNYSIVLNNLYEEYGNDRVQFVGLFPDISSKPEKIEAFREKYQIEFPLKTDYFKTITQKMGAKVTPEVVVFDHDSQTILYKGRIDNMYARVGKKRTVITTSELQDALEAIQEGKPVPVKETKSVGCLINFKKKY